MTLCLGMAKGDVLLSSYNSLPSNLKRKTNFINANLNYFYGAFFKGNREDGGEENSRVLEKQRVFCLWCNAMLN